MNFLLVCGGTAGHINPALAIADELKARMPHARILFVGAGKKLEKDLIPRSGYHLVNIKMSGLRRSFSPADILFNANTLKNLSTAGIKARNLIKRFKPHAVIGTGGYICYPVLKQAAHLKIPTVIHGSDAIPGLTTRMVSGVVDKVLVSFPNLEHLYKKPGKVIFTGTPVRKGFEIAEDSGKQKFIKTSGKPLVVSFWGSQGAEKMNEHIAQMIKINAEKVVFAQIHATGKSEGIVGMMARLNRLGVEECPPDIDIREYIDDMPQVMAAADLVLCRAGASTIAELTAMGKPAILVPSPYVTNNHQEANATQLKKSGGVVMMSERECSGDKLFETITGLIFDKEKLSEMSKAQFALAAPHSTEKIVDIIMQLCKHVA